MSITLARAHITAEERLRALLARGVTGAWAGLPAYDEANVDQWLSTVLPLVDAAQRQSVALTEAFLARSLERQPLGVDPAELTGAAVRAGATPEEVYRRPFVTVWTALKAGRGFEQAVAGGLARATGTGATDVQLSMRATLAAVGRADPGIAGYRRVPDGSACAFCRLVSGQTYHRGDLMPIHTHCGCGVEVVPESSGITLPTGRANGPEDVTRDGVTAAVREHGELGPVLVDGAHAFTGPADLH